MDKNYGSYEIDSVTYDVIKMVISTIKKEVEKNKFENPVVKCAPLLLLGIADRQGISLEEMAGKHNLFLNGYIKLIEDHTLADFGFTITYGLSCPKCRSRDVARRDLRKGTMWGYDSYECMNCGTLFYTEKETR